MHLDRGISVTNALKSLLGPTCQVCKWNGFKTSGCENYIEAHHIVQLSERTVGALCTDNIILVCPNCHRQIHYGKGFQAKDLGESIELTMQDRKALVRKNTLENLRSMKKFK